MILKSKIYKYLAFAFFLSSILGTVTFYMLSKRHKAIVKTTLLHKLHLVNNDWLIKSTNHVFKMYSPDYLIDDIYKSMEGPKSSRYVQLTQTNDLFWIKGFKISALDANSNKPISDDYICHLNVDINDYNYYDNWGLEDRIGKQFPRLTTLSNGFFNYRFPNGYGVPILGNDFLFITTQALNHNEKKIFKKVKHEVNIEYEKSNHQKPLLCKAAYIQLPYNQNNPFKEPLDPASNQCIPVETKNHSYDDGKGNKLSGHWIIPTGKKTYRSSITQQLQIKDSLRMHFSAIHVHPFATSIALFDKTLNKIIFKSIITNYKNKIGLYKIEPFSSEIGVWLYETHEYELILTCNNTTNTTQDMMASMLLYFYDAELDRKIFNK